MLYVNLHTLPPDQSLFTLYVGQRGEPLEQMDEYEIAAPHIHSEHRYLAALVIEKARHDLLRDFGPKAEVRGVINQSAGQILFDCRERGFVPLPVVPTKMMILSFDHPYDALIDLCRDEHDGLGTSEYRDYLLSEG